MLKGWKINLKFHPQGVHFSDERLKSFMKVDLPPLTNPFVAIAEVDSPVMVVTTVAIPITNTDRPFGKRGKKV